MEVLYSRCCGLDVHKSSISACVLIREDGHTQKKYSRYGAMTRDLEELARWLQELGVTEVAMESTGVYWKPVWNVLEGQFHLLLVNAQHVKNVPGRKTDVKDSEWVAELLQHGLLRPSFVPEIRIRDLRDLTRSRTNLSEEASRIVNRIQKVLEDANLKLSSVATNTVGKSALAMLDAVVAGMDDAEALADMALGQLRAKIPQLRAALDGKVRDHHRFLLERLLLQWRFMIGEIAALDQRLEQIGIQHPDLAVAVARWTTIPGIDRVAAWGMVAEMGNNMAQFPTAAQLASWAGMCPGNYESAGKRLGAKMRKGSPWLRRMACQAAWAAARTKNTYLSAQFRRLASRRGKNRAVMAVAHTILNVGYYLQTHQCDYRDLGGDYFDRLHADGLKRYLIRRLEGLGHKVVLLPSEVN